MKSFCQVLAIGFMVAGPAFAAGNKKGIDTADQPDDRGKQTASRPTITRTTGRGAPVISARTVNVTACRPAAQRRNVRRDCEPRPADENNQSLVVLNVVSDDAAMVEYVNEQIQGFYQPGYDWGVLLKGYQIDWAEFVPYLRKYIVDASELGRDAFRRGFIAGYGTSAEATLNNAMRQACQRG